MPSIRKLAAGEQTYDPAAYVGTSGTIFYNEDTGEFRISDGVTAGGNPIPITIATDSTTGAVRPGDGLSITAGGVLNVNTGPSFFFDGDDLLRLRPGTADLIGGIKAGPGVVIDSEGTLFIDSEGLEFSFGDFTATVGTYTDSTEYALLSSVKEDEDIAIASNGDGGVKVVGMFEIHATNGTVTASLETEPFFRILEDGQVRILVPLADTQEGGVEIIGSDLGTALQPGIAGTMLHLTGNADLSTRVYHDTLGSYSSYVFRRYNGSVASPTQVLSGEDIGRINFTAATNAGMGSVALAQISVTALENQSTTAQGSSITLTVTPVGDTAANRVDVVNITSAGVLPGLDDTFDLGSEDRRWQSIYLGPGTIVIEDTVTGSDASLTVTNGVLLIDGANQLQVGQLKFVDNKIESETPDIDIVIGDLTATADLVLNRNVIIGAGKTLTGSVTLAALSAGNYLTGTDYTGATARTFAVDATTTNTASKVVARDASGNFAANMITADLTGTVTGSVTGNAGTVTNGVYTTGGQTIGGVKTFTSTIVGSINGNAGTVTNGVYTTDTATVTNTMLAGSIANNKLANSTISGIALGSNLAALTISTYLTGTSYNGSTAATIAVDATTTNTASKVVARDASGNFAAGTITANLTGTASTATNLAAATSILAGTLSINPGNINKNTSAVQTFTLTGLTTNHKVIITAATEMPNREYFIKGAWASAANTLSVEIANNSGGNIDAGAIDLSYIAFV